MMVNNFYYTIYWDCHLKKGGWVNVMVQMILYKTVDKCKTINVMEDKMMFASIDDKSRSVISKIRGHTPALLCSDKIP